MSSDDTVRRAAEVLWAAELTSVTFTAPDGCPAVRIRSKEEAADVAANALAAAGLLCTPAERAIIEAARAWRQAQREAEEGPWETFAEAAKAYDDAYGRLAAAVDAADTDTDA